MCGRYSLTIIEGFESFFEINEHAAIQPRYNIAPSQHVPAIVADAGGRRLHFMRWGLIPSWSDPQRGGSGWINARSESVDRKPAFKESFAQRRCLLPSDGFYEWIKGPRKRPVHFRLKDGGLFAYAGIWDCWRQPQGEALVSCAILTTPANPLVAKVHDRMPAMLDREAFAAWLDPASAGTSLKALLKAYPAELMRAVPVSRYLNNPFHEGPQCWAQPDDAPPKSQRTLF